MRQIKFIFGKLVLKVTNFVRFLDGRPIEEGEMSMEPEFLVEIMEMNEEIFDAETRCDIFLGTVEQNLPHWY